MLYGINITWSCILNSHHNILKILLYKKKMIKNMQKCGRLKPEGRYSILQYGILLENDYKFDQL
ncbi:hypothetical protein C0J52_21157 [Blattella germanica]|nr:hypothetical protein C0J52_21157 [Blattella germanica]